MSKFLIALLLAGLFAAGCSTMRSAPPAHEMHQTGIESQSGS